MYQQQNAAIYGVGNRLKQPLKRLYGADIRLQTISKRVAASKRYSQAFFQMKKAAADIHICYIFETLCSRIALAERFMR